RPFPPARPARRRRCAGWRTAAPGPRRTAPRARRPGTGAGWPRPHPRADRRRAVPPAPARRRRSSVLPGALIERALAAHAGNRVVHALAQDDPAAVEFDLEHAALGQSQRIAHGLGQGDLAAFGHGGFHRASPMHGTVWTDYTYFRLHTCAPILSATPAVLACRQQRSA